MKNKTVHQYKNISRRSSVYILFDSANKKAQNEILLKNIVNSSYSSLHSNTISNSESITQSNLSQTKPKINQIKKNTMWKGHTYRDNRLPVVTDSEYMLKELDKVSKLNDYYKNLSNENNFGAKYCRHNPAYEDFSKLNIEENILKLGLNNEEKNPLDLIDQKRKYNYNYNIYNNTSCNRDKYPLLQNPKNRKMNYSSDKNYKYKLKTKKNCTILNPFKAKDYSSFIKKDEFSDFLIMEYINKYYYPSIKSNNKNKEIVNNNKEKKLTINCFNNKIEARKIYVIKDASVISNPRFIPGFIVLVPTINGLKILNKKQRTIIMNNFLEFITIKFRSQLPFNYIFDKNGNTIYDFKQLSKNDKYIFVSPVNIFKGISISMHRGFFELYMKHFGKIKNDDNFFNESSLESINDNQIIKKKNLKKIKK